MDWGAHFSPYRYTIIEELLDVCFICGLSYEGKYVVSYSQNFLLLTELIYSLFNNAFGNSDYTELNDKKVKE
jgi:hypothetical protein